MSRQWRKKRIVSGILWMLLAGTLASPVAAAPQTADTSESYTTPDITVEAKRPDWEESLSPGTVTVIRPEEFKGEQKSLPDFLQMVPGVHVREVNGKGQYTTVTVRGSTAAQVGVFIDGVLTNLGGDAAVDLSAIPIRNVERIEVYRGYIPARFGGTFIGGVVNIVTKKPQGAHGSAEVGPGSFGSKKASVEITAPVGSGSLLFGFNHESRDGDFPYRSYAAEQWMNNSLNGARYQELIRDQRTHMAMTQAEREDFDRTYFPGAWEQVRQGYIDSIAELSDKAAAAEDSRRWRKYNDYKNTDAMLKWQNKDWMIKGTYKTINRHLPDSLWITSNSYAELIDPGLLVDRDKDLYRFDSRRQKITASELMVENRHSHERLDWGWMVDYLHQSKDYRAEHIYNEDRKWENVPMRRWSRYRSNKYNVQVDGSYQISKRNLLDFQMNFSHERMKINGDGLNDVIKDVATGYLNFYAQMRNQYDQEIFNAQLQDTITFDDRGSWQLTPSVRFNRSKIIGYSQFGRFDPRKTYHWIHPKDSQVDQKVTWQLALKHVFSDHFSMRMTGGTYFRLLNMYEIAGDGAGILPRPRNWVAKESVFPQPEYGKQFDLSAIWDGKFLGAANRTTLTYFWRDTQRMLQLYRAGLTYSSFYNDVRGKVHGIELQTNFHWKKFDLDLEGTHLKISVQRQDSSPGVHYPWYEVHPTYQPEWEGNIRLTYRPTERWLFFGEGHYMSKYYTHYAITTSEPELSGRPTEAYMTFNTGLKWSPRKDMTLTLGCNDVFDRGPQLKAHSLQAFYSHPSAVNIEYPLQGRSYYMSFRYEF